MPFIEDELRTGRRPDPRPGAFLVEVTERELNDHHDAVVEAVDILLAVHHAAAFMQSAMGNDLMDRGALRAFLALIARATDPSPRLSFESAENFAERLLCLKRHKPDGTA